MTRSETKLSVAIRAPVSGQSAVNVATATSKCSITFLLPYDQDGDVKTKQDNVKMVKYWSLETHVRDLILRSFHKMFNPLPHRDTYRDFKSI